MRNEYKSIGIIAGVLFFVWFVGMAVLAKMCITENTPSTPLAISTFRVLPKGEYRIYGVNTTPSGNGDTEYMFLVSSVDGGILIAAKPPQGTDIPEPFTDTAGYVLNVDEDGIWQIKETEEHHFFTSVVVRLERNRQANHQI